jgi:hypothetical protein
MGTVMEPKQRQGKLCSIPDTQVELGGLGRTSIYSLIESGDLQLVKIGARSFVTVDSIQAFVTRLAQGE